MVTRPTAVWRDAVQAEEVLVADGIIDREDAIRATLYPPRLLQRVDTSFDMFESSVRSIQRPDEQTLVAAIKDVVIALNKIDDDFDDAFETPERDLLCSYIEAVVTEAGHDLDTLARRHGATRADLIDRWRTW